MHVRNTFDRYACLELGILVRPVFTNILLLACLLDFSLKNGLQFKTICLLFNYGLNQNHLLTCLLEKWFNNSKPFAYLLFEIWFYNLKPLLAKFLACFSNMVE